MIRLIIGLALMPSAALTMLAAAHALASIIAASSAFPFLSGLLLALACWLFGRYCTVSDSGPAGWTGALTHRLYVFGHELTHAMAAWSVGGKVLGFKVGEAGGHVDLSQTSAFIALAPYCVPIYTVGVIIGYRLLLWLKPPSGNHGIFLILVGLTLAFHGLKTFEVLWDNRQPDLAQAGGVVFSLAWIALANGFVVLLLLKALFPDAVPLGADLRAVGQRTAGFWRWLWHFLRPLTTGFASQLNHP
ncbi:MAG: hypothetical protein HY077_07320 [Elusimicrobia bacterium]|nr:hypothetical protein [Elusimicrobiota bacterium]